MKSRDFHARGYFRLGYLCPDPPPPLVLGHSLVSSESPVLKPRLLEPTHLSPVDVHPFPRVGICLGSIVTTIHRQVHRPGSIQSHPLPASWALKFNSPFYPPTWDNGWIVWLGKVDVMMVLKGHQPSRGHRTRCGLTRPPPLCLGQRQCGSSSAWSQCCVGLSVGGASSPPFDLGLCYITRFGR